MGDFLKKVLPWIGAAATGGVPALIGMAASQVSQVLGVPVDANPEAIGKAVANATPEQMVQLRDRELTFQEHMQAMGFQNTQELARIGLEETKAYIADTADARARFSADKGVFWLGIAVLITFAGIMGAALFGSYQLLIGGIPVKDVATVGLVFGFIGTIIGYAAANAQQVVGYFFGSSKGSADKTGAMASAFQSLGQRRGEQRGA